MTRGGARRGGRKGQTYTAKPNLQSYDITPASEVTVTRADGTVVTEPAKQAKATVPARRSKGPAVCAICGYAIKGRVLYSWERGRARNKPVHGRCDPKARPERPPRPGASKNAYATEPPKKRPPGPRKPVGTCPKCGAPPGERCTVQYADGTTGQVEIGHLQRRTAPDT
ncbi:hypothetical protein ACFT0G_02855 [Streptomyces sp. NPDC057020]|uniref:hypothetical protein n=1 Tax=unclassified Streptomyces TaxID=2593676 RepID=UPI003635DFC9